MLVYVKEPRKQGYLKEIENTLNAKQELVGGLLEDVALSQILNDSKIIVYGNDEAKLLGLEANVVITDFDLHAGTAKLIDILAGTLFFCGTDDEGNDLPLSSAQLTLLESVMIPLDSLPGRESHTGLYVLPFTTNLI